MNKHLQTAYDYSPYHIKNLFAMFYGLRLQKLRYGDKFEEYFDELLASPYTPSEEMEEKTLASLLEILLYCENNVPFYREKWQALGISPGQFNNLDDIKKLPVISKPDIVGSPHSFISPLFNKKACFIDSTSGSTGTPLHVTISKECLRFNYALYQRTKHWAGVKPGMKEASLGGQLVVPFKRAKKPFWVKNHAGNQLYLSSYHLNSKNIDDYIEALNEFSPLQISGYPSSIFALASLSKSSQIKFQPRAIFTNAETLYEYQRELIEHRFGCKVYDCYGLTEQVCFISQCGSSSYHISSEFGLVEILDDNNQPVDEGKTGNLVCTGIKNLAMPLIRYNTGDKAIVGRKDCSCGMNLPTISGIIGREDDPIVTPDGRIIGRLHRVFQDANNIVEAQIVQDDISRMAVNIVKSDTYSESDTAFVLGELRARVGDEIKIDFNFLDSIPRGANGKLKFVISHVDSPAPVSL